VVGHMARTGAGAPVTTSAGRLFDAVAAICGLRTATTYEGQAAVELEAACDLLERGTYPMPGLDPREAIAAVARDAAAGEPVGAIAMRFHRGLAGATAAACAEVAEEYGLATVVLSGGVFQNRVLTELTRIALERCALRILMPQFVPANDGGISYGQAAIAAARDAR
jgi:hydrogenase maturation protein HypF